MGLEWSSWQTWIYLLLLIIFLLWLFSGGKNYEYIGITPLLNNQPFPDIPLRSNPEPLLHPDAIARRRFQTNSSNEQKPMTYEVSNTRPEQIQYKGESQFPAGFTSRGEKICREFLEQHYGKPFPNCRPDFLRNPETGQNLELDCYNDELGIAVEYSGMQHYVYPNHCHKNYEQFEKQLRRDKFKLRQCEANNVYLIRVPYTIRFKDIPDYIYQRLPENRKDDDDY